MHHYLLPAPADHPKVLIREHPSLAPASQADLDVEPEHLCGEFRVLLINGAAHGDHHVVEGLGPEPPDVLVVLCGLTQEGGDALEDTQRQVGAVGGPVQEERERGGNQGRGRKRCEGGA